ncbi:adenylate/guanylate cyclase domain-containing protein [Nocardioides sp.]|uniref:adenylate/guanylate cyclase domain-containing protein n=1 Tax=Nocardioides sp. TaxID=35761 RepID=UPI0035129749
MTPEDPADPALDERAAGRGTPVSLGEAAGVLEALVLGETPSLTRLDVNRLSGVPQLDSERLWGLLGFAQVPDDEVAFTSADVDALRLARELVALGILTPERQDALVRTWGRSFARLAEWQTSLLATVAIETAAADPGASAAGYPVLVEEVLPRVEALQAYVWRRHLASAAGRLLEDDPTSPTVRAAVGFVDIVGYTARSTSLEETELVEWLEGFEATVTAAVVAAGGRVIKNIGDEVLFVSDDVHAAARVLLDLTRRAADPDDTFPDVRAGLAWGEVVARLGDVFGPTVNLAARLTSGARPHTVLVDAGARTALEADPDLRLRRVRGFAAKGYGHLGAWRLRRADDPD